MKIFILSILFCSCLWGSPQRQEDYSLKAMDDIARCIPHLEQILEKRKGKREIREDWGEHSVMIYALLADQHGEVQYVRDDGVSQNRKYMFSLDDDGEEVSFEPDTRYIAFFFWYWQDSGPLEVELIFLCDSATGEVKGFWRAW